MERVSCPVVRIATWVVVFAGLALAQNPAPTLREQGLAAPLGTQVEMPAGYIPAYCNPCLFYGGDGDPGNPNQNGLWDNKSSYFGVDQSVFSPFVVPKKTGNCGNVCAWHVSGLSANIGVYPYPPVMNDAVWSIVGPNTFPGSEVCHGTDTAPTITATGRSFDGYEEYNVAIHVSGLPLPRRSEERYRVLGEGDAGDICTSVCLRVECSRYTSTERLRSAGATG